MDTSQILSSFRAQVRDLGDGVDEADIDRVVEVGTMLASMVNIATKALDDVKRRLREEALAQLNNQPGTVALDGTALGKVNVTVPPTRFRIVKGTNVEQLQVDLGAEFDAYFEAKVDYKLRPALKDGIPKTASEDEKDVLLNALESFSGTPRVSFTKR